ncbi:hypothetical protein VTN02DRAFT_1137 [Thermoascus thermophilus]
METLRAPPATASFTPLAEHQSRTPASFYSAPPVLHYHGERCKVVILERDLAAAPSLNALRGQVVSNGDVAAAAAAVNGSSAGHAAAAAAAVTTAAGGDEREEEEEEDKEVVIDGVDVWVTSEKFLLYRPAAVAGVAIPYPSISLHAIQRLRLPDSTEEVQGLYMQIAIPPAEVGEEDEEEESITLTVVPPPPAAPAAAAEQPTPGTQEVEMTEGTEKPEETPTQALFAAVSACSNLHPDPVEEADEDEEGYEGGVQGSSLYQSGLIAPGSGNGGLPPPMEGSSGWITAENMHEYFDEQGNWIGGGEEPTLPLGPGAGTVREREEEDGNGEGGESEETKWRRTD